MRRPEDQNRFVGRKDPTPLDSTDFLVFLIPSLDGIVLKLVGVLMGSDLLVLAVFFYLALSGKIRIPSRAGKTYLVLGLLWLASQIVTDIVRHIAFRDYARGWSLIALTLINFVVLCTLAYGRPRRLLAYGWGMVVGGFFAFFLNSAQFVAGEPWKFGFGPPITLAVFLFASRKDCPQRLAVAFAATIGVVNIAAGSREAGGNCLLAMLYLALTGVMRKRAAAGRRLKSGTIVALAGLIVLGAVAVMWAYEYAASTGTLGVEAQQKYEEEAAGKYGVILGGRIELLGEVPAILQSPILGHGSWAKDPLYQLLERQALLRLGYKSVAQSEITPQTLRSGDIPSHSHIFGAWVRAGIVGAIFWVWVFFFAARTLMRVYPANVTLLPVAAFVGFLTMWDILFSPMGLTTRINDPYYFVLLMTCLGMSRRKFARPVPAAVTLRRAPLKPSLKAT